MKNQNIYGIKSTSINHHVIYTFKIRVTKNLFNNNIIKDSGLHFYYTLSKKNKEMITMEYATLDHSDFNQKSLILLKVLKKIALNNVEEKYRYIDYMEDLKNECELNSLENQVYEG